MLLCLSTLGSLPDWGLNGPAGEDCDWIGYIGRPWLKDDLGVAPIVSAVCWFKLCDRTWDD